MGQRFPDGLTLTDVWATVGDKQSPTAFTIQQGWPSSYDSVDFPTRTNFNFAFNQPWAVCADINRNGGALPWDSSITYLEGALVSAGTPSRLYQSRIDNNLNIPPPSNPASWTLFVPEEEIPNYYFATGTNDYNLNAISPFKQATQYFDGLVVFFVPTNTNNGACTLSIGLLPPVPLLDLRSNPLISGEIRSFTIVSAVYVGGNFLLFQTRGTPKIQAKFNQQGIIQGIPTGITQANVTAPTSASQSPAAAYIRIDFPVPFTNANYLWFLNFGDTILKNNSMIGGDSVTADDERIPTVANPAPGEDYFPPTTTTFYIIPSLNDLSGVLSKNDVNLPPGGVTLTIYENQ